MTQSGCPARSEAYAKRQSGAKRVQSPVYWIAALCSQISDSTKSMTQSGCPARSGVRVRSTGLPRSARNDAKRQSDAKRRIREATVRRKAKRTQSPEGATRPHPDASASGHNTLRAKRSNTLWASPPRTFRASASEAKRLPYCRFASLRGTKQSR